VKSHCHYNNCHHDDTKKYWNKNNRKLKKDKEGNQDINNGSNVVFLGETLYSHSASLHLGV